MTIVEGVISLFTILSILFFLVQIVGLFRMPTGDRARTPTYNRFGEVIGMEQNPGFQETEEERHP
jgi:hypothetical protein